MLANNQMIENHYLRWHKARRMIGAIQKHLAQGHTVYISTYTKCMKFDRRHIDMFKACKNGAFRQAGRNWVCIDYCNVQVFA